MQRAPTLEVAGRRLRVFKAACVPRSRCRCIVRADGKGFGATDNAAAASDVKVSKRGTLASRPGPQSAADARKEQAMYERMARQQQKVDASADDDAREVQEVPQAITDRMLKRIVLFSGVPVLTGFALYPLFYYIKVVQHVDLPMWVVYIVQLMTFGGGVLGITYGVMSASWDPNRDGSLLGWTEFRANLPVLLDRFRGGRR